MTTLLRLPDVLARTALSRSALYVAMERGDFPKPVKLAARANAWPDHEIEAWIKRRLSEREAA